MINNSKSCMALSVTTAAGNSENRNFAGELLKTPGLIFSRQL